MISAIITEVLDIAVRPHPTTAVEVVGGTRDPEATLHVSNLSFLESNFCEKMPLILVSEYVALFNCLEM